MPVKNCLTPNFFAIYSSQTFFFTRSTEYTLQHKQTHATSIATTFSEIALASKLYLRLLCLITIKTLHFFVHFKQCLSYVYFIKNNFTWVVGFSFLENYVIFKSFLIARFSVCASFFCRWHALRRFSLVIKILFVFLLYCSHMAYIKLLNMRLWFGKNIKNYLQFILLLLHLQFMYQVLIKDKFKVPDGPQMF